MGTKTVAAVDGVATFEGLAINAPGYKTLKATAGELTKAVSDSFDVGAKLVITPVAQKVAGETFTNFAVRVTDHAGKTLTTNSADVTLSLATSPEGATIDGTTTVTAVNGVATFSDVDLQTAGVYRISADAAGLVGATTYYFRVIPAAPAALTFTQDASNLTAGAAITAMKVQVVDAFGNLCVYGNRVVTLAKKTGPGAVTGWLKAATVNGVATFGAVRAVTAGDYVLTASLDTLTVDSAQFTVSPAAAKKVVFTQQPTAAGVNTNIAPAITASIQDAYGNVVTTSTATITLTQAQGPAGGIATASKAAVAGVATFNTVKATKTGSYRIRLSGTGLVAATSSLFTISNNG
jgi:hypothetical protein